MTLLCLDVPVNTARLYTLCPALDCPEEQVKRTHESLAYHPPLGTLMLSPGPPHLWGFPQVWGAWQLSTAQAHFPAKAHHSLPSAV
jgi:hypothetical protein